MNDIEKRAHDIALCAAMSKIIALINDCNRTGRMNIPVRRSRLSGND